MLAFEGGGTRAGTSLSHGYQEIGRVIRALNGSGARGPRFGLQKGQLAGRGDECWR
jgi:hypothetical protein